jgi:transcriptional regulator with XRE-family HTH domain
MSVKKKNTHTYSIGKRFSSFRDFKNLTGAQLGKILGVSQSAISDIEKGKSNPSAETIAAFVKYTDINPYWLLYGDGPMIREPDLRPAEIRTDRSRPEEGGPDLYKVVEPVSGKATIVTNREMRQIHKLLCILKSGDKGVVQAIETDLREFTRLSRLVNARFGDIIILERRLNNIPVENDRRKKVK